MSTHAAGDDVDTSQHLSDLNLAMVTECHWAVELLLLLLLLYFTSPELQAVKCLLTRPGLVLTNDEDCE